MSLSMTLYSLLSTGLSEEDLPNMTEKLLNQNKQKPMLKVSF